MLKIEHKIILYEIKEKKNKKVGFIKLYNEQQEILNFNKWDNLVFCFCCKRIWGACFHKQTRGVDLTKKHKKTIKKQR